MELVLLQPHKPLVGEAVSALNANISDPMALHRDDIMAHDAAVTALGKICLCHEDRINASEVFSTWLSHLPIKNNLLEVKIAHELLCSIVEISKDELLCRHFIHLPRIVAAFAEKRSRWFFLWWLGGAPEGAAGLCCRCRCYRCVVGAIKDKLSLPWEWLALGEATGAEGEEASARRELLLEERERGITAYVTCCCRLLL